MSLDNVRIVLVRPKGSRNVGSVARAMKNMGLRDLVLVAPRNLDTNAARSMATHGLDVLEAARTSATVAEAVAGCGWVFGTTAREGGYRVAPVTPRDAAVEITPLLATNRVALVFGPEDHGLSNEDIEVCNRLIRIPTSTAFASLNLAQAVLICAYELQLTQHPGISEQETRPLAGADEVSLMFDKLQQALLRIGFIHPQNPDHIMHAVRRLFGRVGLEAAETRILLGIARQIEWCAARAGLSPAADKSRPEQDKP